jgi:4-hydroxy-2-oxoheptanedioate aldolase
MNTTPSNRFLAHMRAGKVENMYSLGGFASPRHVDYICSRGKFDSLWFDIEHADIGIQDLAILNLVARAYPVTTIARFHATDYQAVMRVMETGVGGIMCSMVETAQDARNIVQWAKFNNPRPLPGEVIGLRGWNAGGVDARYGMLPAQDYVSQQNNEVAIICQIETPEAVARLDEIVAVEGVDGFFFGPGDYAHRIGRMSEVGHPEVLSAVGQLAEACQRHGKFWGTISLNLEHYKQVKALGARFIGAAGDVRLMNYGFRELLKMFETE